MRVVNVTLPLLVAVLLAGINTAAWAQKSAALDPYSFVKAPTKEERDAMNNRGKKKKVDAEVSNLGQSTNMQNGIAGPIDVVLDSVKQSSANLGKGIASGTAGVLNGTKKLGSKLTGGLVGKTDASESSSGKVAALPKKEGGSKVKDSEKPKDKDANVATKSGPSAMEKISAMPKAVAGGFMSAGGAVKNGTVSVAKGFKSAGGKLVDGTKDAGGKLASLPKAVLPGGKKEKNDKKKEPVAVAAKDAASVQAPPTEGTAAPPQSTPDPLASGLRPEKDLVSATEKGTSLSSPKSSSGGLGGAAKKLVAAPRAGLNVIGAGFGKLNPFHKESKAPSLAGAEQKKQLASPGTNLQ